jgi:minichromosome maintenance protein 10
LESSEKEDNAASFPKHSEDPLFQDPIKVPLVKNPKVEGTKSRGSSKDVSNVVDKSKDELQAELLRMKSEVDLLRQQLASKSDGKSKSSTVDEREHTRACGQAQQTFPTRRKEHCPSTAVPSVKSKLSQTLDDLHKVSRGKVSGSIKAKSRAAKPNPQLKGRELLAQRKQEISAVDDTQTVTDKYSGLRIRSPFLSTSEMDERMEGRKMIKLHRIASKVKDGDIEGNWVTIGVIIEKLPPKDSVKGDKYSVLKLSDLSSLANVVSLFLFGNAHKQHWKMSIGTVVALLNPGLKSEAKSKDQVSAMRYTLSLDHQDKLMELGQSRDFTQCKAMVKSGSRRCTNFANMRDGGYCDYHIHGAYRRMQGGRGEFQSGYGPSHAGGLAKLKKSLKNETGYFSKPLKGVTSSNNRLFAPGAQEEASLVTAECKERQKDRPKVQRKGDIVISEGSDLHKYLLQGQCVGARNLNKAFKAEEEKKIDNENSSMSANDVLKKQKKMLQFSSPKPAVAGTIGGNVSKKILSPVLGRGVSFEGEIDLSREVDLATSLPKVKALMYVKKNGPISKPNQTSSKKARLSEKKQEIIRKRALEGSARVGTDSSDSGTGMEGTPKKRSKFDLNSDEVQKIINAKSAHSWEAEEEEWEQEQVYFEHLEKVEAMEDKIKSITEIRVNVVKCEQCDYIAEGASELCRKESHKLTRFKAVKRFFECKNCKQRLSTYNQVLPTRPCRACGCHNYQKTSMSRVSVYVHVSLHLLYVQYSRVS